MIVTFTSRSIKLLVTVSRDIHQREEIMQSAKDAAR
jgi:hypothetical protein